MKNFRVWDISEDEFFLEAANVLAANRREAVESVIGHEVANVGKGVFTDGRRKFRVRPVYLEAT